MTQTDAYTLNESQLELVFNLPYYATLYLFKTPLTPSAAARRLQVPANVMHYRVKRLYEAGLLEVADDNGRSRSYRSVSQEFSVPPEVLPAVTEAVPAMLDTMLSKLHRHVLESTEKELWDLEALTQDGPFTFDLGEPLIFGPEDRYFSRVSVSSIDLSADQYRRVVETVMSAFDKVQQEVKNSSEGETTRCTLAFMAFQGQGAM